MMFPLMPSLSSRNRRVTRVAALGAIGLLIGSFVAGPAAARIRLVSLPARERVEVQLDHPDVTLIEEERIVPLIEGVNQIDFSWANTAIDPGTIVFRVLGPVGDDPPADEGEEAQEGLAVDPHADPMEVNVIAVSYPPNENALVWDVAASRSGSVRVRISYILGGLNRSFTYRAVVANDESSMTLSQYIRVHNFAPEQYGPTTLYTGYGEPIDRPLGGNETRELLVSRYSEVPIRKTYTCDPAQFGYNDRARDRLTVPMHYELTNDTENGLGIDPLAYGKVRIFQTDSRGTTAFTGEDWGAYTPLEDTMRLSLGVAQDVIVERKIIERERTTVAGNLYHLDVVIQYAVQNTKDQPVTLDIQETLTHLRNELGLRGNHPTHWEIGDRTTLTRIDAEVTEHSRIGYQADLAARTGDETEEQTFLLHIRLLNEW